jgi:glycosyltransferase involved in cell wall biosynthesis
MRRLRIAQVAPLFESVPPTLYGGTERVVSFLTEALVSQGHDVTLFASGDSVTTSRLVKVCENSLRLNNKCIDQLAHHIAQLQMVQNELEHFDVVHYHTDYLHFPLSKKSSVPHVTTLHGRLDIPDLQNLYRLFTEIPLVSISDSQRAPLPYVNWIDTIYHGLPQDLFNPNYGEGNYLAFLGRVSAEKRVDRAIDIACSSNIPLKIAAKIDTQDREYFEQKIKGLLDHPLIDFIGEIGESEKQEFLGNATALLFPIDWSEPFGLVMIEALACGTPVIAYRRGSVPEIIEHGRSGFIVDNQKSAIKAVQNISSIDRRECRKAFEERFTSSQMAEGYAKVYQQLMDLHNNTIDLKLLQS